MEKDTDPNFQNCQYGHFVGCKPSIKKHAEKSMCRILSGHRQPAIRPVLFPNTTCKLKEVTGSKSCKPSEHDILLCLCSPKTLEKSPAVWGVHTGTPVLTKPMARWPVSHCGDAREQFQPGAETVVLQQQSRVTNMTNDPGQLLHSLGFHLMVKLYSLS